MTTQTALAQWPLTDPEWWLIDPSEWQEGQRWWYSPSNFGSGAASMPTGDWPVWVRELLPLPAPAWPYDKIAWLGDVPVALAGDLPGETITKAAVSGVASKAHNRHPSEIVSVRAWPDGTNPVKPTRRFTATVVPGRFGYAIDFRDGGSVLGRFSYATPEQAAAFVAQVNRDGAP